MVLAATQVKRRRGTTAENDAFTGAEGEITVDTEKHELRVHDGVTQGGFKIGGGSGSGRNIGDIFYTARTDTALAGAVECNGGTYNTTDYDGDGSIGELLEAGKLPYVSLTDYATQITNNGVCGVFGWDGTGTTTFRVPTLQDVFVECGQASQLGNYIPAGLPNISGIVGGGIYAPSSGCGYKVDSSVPYEAGSYRASGGNKVGIDASLSSSIYGNSDTVQPKAIKYRAMVQLFNSTTDEAVATVGTVVAQVGALNTRTDGMIDYVVESQLPTAGNGYTWYRKYKSGWVEQGGRSGGKDVTITMPVEMSDNHYVVLTDVVGNVGYGELNWQISPITTTGFRCFYDGDSSDPTEFSWQVSGMSAQ